MQFYDGDYTFYTGVIAVCLLVLWQLNKMGRRPAKYPPGPPTYPIIGNLHQIPSTGRHLQFEEWAREYGPVYSLMLGTKVMIVLNSDVAVKTLLDKRGAIYSSRPEAYIAQDVLSAGLRILFMPNKGAWTVVRKFAHRVLNAGISKTYLPYQELENRAMLVGFLETPNDFISHLRRYTASLTTQMTFGFRTTTIQEPRFKEAFDIFDKSSEMNGSVTATLLDIVPVLRRLPESILSIKKEGRSVHDREMKLFRGLYLQAKHGLQNGTVKPCICVDIAKLQEDEDVSDDFAAYIAGSLLQAGSETTSSILVGFVQAMVIFPDVARTAQVELDRVCGDFLPSLDDLPDLPYICASIKETLRWMPGFMLGVPHAVTQDDSYDGYDIPKGSIVILNVWAIHNDPKRHPDPRRFDPMRYINDHQTSVDAANNPDATKRDHFVFGAGRRRCQGMHIADRSLFLAVSRLLWAFNFDRAIDNETGQEIVPDMADVADGVMTMPNAFPAAISPRSQAKAELIRQEWGKMADLLDEEEQWKAVPEGLIWNKEKSL